MIELDLCPMFIGHYNKGYLDYLITSVVPKIVLLKVYKLALREESLTPIENLSEDMKKSLVSECRATGIKFSNKSLIEAAKILHIVRFIKDKSKT